MDLVFQQSSIIYGSSSGNYKPAAGAHGPSTPRADRRQVRLSPCQQQIEWMINKALHCIKRVAPGSENYRQCSMAYQWRKPAEVSASPETANTPISIRLRVIGFRKGGDLEPYSYTHGTCG